MIVARYPGVTRRLLQPCHIHAYRIICCCCCCIYSNSYRATSFAERLRLGIAVIHGEPKGEREDGRNSPPPLEVELMDRSLSGEVQTGQFTANLLPVVPKEKPPLNVVGDVHGKIGIIVVRLKLLIWICSDFYMHSHVFYMHLLAFTCILHAFTCILHVQYSNIISHEDKISVSSQIPFPTHG